METSIKLDFPYTFLDRMSTRIGGLPSPELRALAVICFSSSRQALFIAYQCPP